MNPGATWLAAFTQGVKATTVDDGFISAGMKKLSNSQSIQTFLIAVPLTVLSVILGIWNE